MKKQNFLTKLISIFLSFNLLLSNLLYPFTILAREADEDDYYSQPQAAETSSPPQQQEVSYEEVYYPPPVAEPPAYPTPQYQQETPYEETHPAPPPPAPEPQAEAPQPTTPPWVEPERVQEVAYEETHPAPQSTPPPSAYGLGEDVITDGVSQQEAITSYSYQGSSYERDYDNAYSEVRADLNPSPGPAQTVAEAPAAASGFLGNAWNTISGLPGNVAQSVGSRFTSHPAQNSLGSQDNLDGSLNTTVTTTTNALENTQTPQGFMNMSQDECNNMGLVPRSDGEGNYQGCAFDGDYSKAPPEIGEARI